MTLRRVVPVIVFGCIVLSSCRTHTGSASPSQLPEFPSPTSPAPGGETYAEILGTLPPTSGPPVITVLQGANDAAPAKTAPGQFFASGGPVTVGALRLVVTSPKTGSPTLAATDTRSGREVWAYKDATEPDLLEFAVGGGVVVIGVGHEVGAAMVYAATEHLDVVDLATGTPLWRSTVTGDVQSPALVAMPGLVVFESTGHAVAVHARTGVLAWTDSAQPGCPEFTPGDGGLTSLAADADVLAATFGCGSGAVTQRLNLGTGAATWTTPLYSGGQSELLAVPVNTDVVVIPEMGNGSYLEGPIRQWIPAGVPEDDTAGAVYTVLDVATGAVRWTEAGAPIYNAGAYGDNAGSLCFIGAHTYECRSPKDGTLVRVGGPASP
ncbi:MAG TPA: PQQ-binding-like beta-propeller repeat protein [Acidothermaceae bacterium]